MKKDKPKEREIDPVLFERILTYNILTNEYYASIVSDVLKPEYIDSPGNRLVANVVLEFYRKRNALPNATELKLYLTDETERALFKETINSFKGLDSKYNLDELILNTEKFIKEKAVYKAVMQTIDEYSKGESNPTDTYQLFDKACNISLVDNLGLNFFKQIPQFVSDIKKTDTFISSGWKWLDDKLNGGFLASGKALYVFSGQTNVGKSIFLGNIAANIAASGKTVVVITLEMPETVYGKRISSKLTQIPFKDLQHRTGELEDGLTAYSEQNPQAQIIFKEFPPKAVSVNHIKAYLKKLETKGIKIDAVVLDYLNLIAPLEGDNSYEKIKDIAEKVRALSYIFKCPFISATQLNRSGYNTSPELDQISESMGLGHTADVMIGIYQEEGDDVLGNLRLNMMKNRFGEKQGMCIMKIEYSTLTLTEGENHFGDDNEVSKAENALNLLSDKS